MKGRGAMKKTLLLVALSLFLVLNVLMSESTGKEALSYPPMTATIKTNKGDIRLKLFPNEAPLTVLNFVNLSEKGFYDNLVFHRVIPGFVIQGGCPLGTGTGDPGYRFKDEFSPKLKHDKPGILSMANAGPGTNGSQFFITHAPTPHLDNRHTVFGQVVGQEDQDVVNRIVAGDRMETILIEGDHTKLTDNHREQLDRWNKALGKK